MLEEDLGEQVSKERTQLSKSSYDLGLPKGRAERSFYSQVVKGKHGVTRSLRVDLEGPLQKRHSPFCLRLPCGQLWLC